MVSRAGGLFPRATGLQVQTTLGRTSRPVVFLLCDCDEIVNVSAEIHCFLSVTGGRDGKAAAAAASEVAERAATQSGPPSSE